MIYNYYKLKHATYSVYFRHDVTLNTLLAISHEPDSLVCDFQLVIQERKNIDIEKWKEGHAPGLLHEIDDVEFFQAYIDYNNKREVFQNYINFQRIEQLNEKMATRHVSDKSKQLTA
jgi:hypothetical protein